MYLRLYKKVVAHRVGQLETKIPLLPSLFLQLSGVLITLDSHKVVVE